MNQVSPKNSRGIMKELDYFSPIENRGGVQYLSDGSRRVTFEIDEINPIQYPNQ
jgi:hypothetical protein